MLVDTVTRDWHRVLLCLVVYVIQSGLMSKFAMYSYNEILSALLTPLPLHPPRCFFYLLKKLHPNDAKEQGGYIMLPRGSGLGILPWYFLLLRIETYILTIF